MDNLLSTALDADEEALAVARAALESSEAESDEEPPEEPVCSPTLSPCTQEPTLAVDSIGVRLVPWGSVHAVQCTQNNSVQTSCGLRLKHCSYPVHQIHPDTALQTQGVYGRAVLKSTLMRRLDSHSTTETAHESIT